MFRFTCGYLPIGAEDNCTLGVVRNRHCFRVWVTDAWVAGWLVGWWVVAGGWVCGQGGKQYRLKSFREKFPVFLFKFSVLCVCVTAGPSFRLLSIQNLLLFYEISDLLFNRVGTPLESTHIHTQGVILCNLFTRTFSKPTWSTQY